MAAPEISKRLIVTPMLNKRASVGEGAIDVRLGNQFIVFKRESFPVWDVKNLRAASTELHRYQERIIRPFGTPIVVHPGQLVIGSTLEYIQVPRGLMAYVIGKSSWGRLGLIIATATKVDPGFCGCITLEIVNEGEVPLQLYPGLPIAQLVLHPAEKSDGYTGGYGFAIGPEFPKFDQRHENWEIWTDRKRGMGTVASVSDEKCGLSPSASRKVQNQQSLPSGEAGPRRPLPQPKSAMRPRRLAPRRRPPA